MRCPRFYLYTCLAVSALRHLSINQQIIGIRLRLVHTGQILAAAIVDESPRKQPEEPSLDSSLLSSTIAALRFAMPGFRLHPFRFVFFCQNLSSVNQPLENR